MNNIEKMKQTWYILLQFVLTTATYPVVSGMSTYVVERGIGSSVAAGTLLAVYMAGGIAVNFILQALQRTLGQFLISAAFAVTAVGTLLILAVPSFWAVGLGAFVCGLGFLCLFSLFQLLNGLEGEAEHVALRSTLILAANQLGVFVSSYFISGAQAVFHLDSEMESSFLGACAVCAFLAVLAGVLRKKLNPGPGIAEKGGKDA